MSLVDVLVAGKKPISDWRKISIKFFVFFFCSLSLQS